MFYSARQASSRGLECSILPGRPPCPAEVWYVLLCLTGRQARPRFGMFYSAWLAARPSQGLVYSTLPGWPPGPAEVWYVLLCPAGRQACSTLPDWPAGPAEVWYVLLCRAGRQAQQSEFSGAFSTNVAFLTEFDFSAQIVWPSIGHLCTTSRFIQTVFGVFPTAV